MYVSIKIVGYHICISRSNRRQRRGARSYPRRSNADRAQPDCGRPLPRRTQARAISLPPATSGEQSNWVSIAQLHKARADLVSSRRRKKGSRGAAWTECSAFGLQDGFLAYAGSSLTPLTRPTAHVFTLALHARIQPYIIRLFPVRPIHWVLGLLIRDSRLGPFSYIPHLLHDPCTYNSFADVLKKPSQGYSNYSYLNGQIKFLLRESTTLAGHK